MLTTETTLRGQPRSLSDTLIPKWAKLVCYAMQIAKETDEKKDSRNKEADSLLSSNANSWKPRSHACGQIRAPPTSLIKQRNRCCQRRRAISVQARHQVSFQRASESKRERKKKPKSRRCCRHKEPISHTHFKKFNRFNIEATKLTKKGLFSSDPSSFFVIHRASENGVFAPIYQSPVVRSKSNPIWAEFSMKEIQLCNGDPNRQLKIEVKKHKENGRE